MREKLATFVLIACALFLGFNTGAGLYQHMFDIPKMLSSPAAMTFASNNDAGQAQYFWIPLHALILVTLILSAIFNWNNPGRKKLVLTALGIYLYIAVVSIYFAYKLTVFATMPDAPEFYRETRQWIALSWHRPLLQVIAEVLLLLAISKSRVN
jgi:hypothetical protein